VFEFSPNISSRLSDKLTGPAAKPQHEHAFHENKHAHEMTHMGDFKNIDDNGKQAPYQLLCVPYLNPK
jgi:hypothetical protein